MNRMTVYDQMRQCFKVTTHQETGRSVIQELGIYEDIHEEEIKKARNITDIRDLYFTKGAKLDPYWENFGKEKIKAYEEKQTDDEIKVGDEVIYNGKPHNGEVGLVIGLCEKWVEVRFKSRWNCVGVYRDTVTKTGRSFPQIAEVLKQMDGGE